MRPFPSLTLPLLIQENKKRHKKDFFFQTHLPIAVHFMFLDNLYFDLPLLSQKQWNSYILSFWATSQPAAQTYSAIGISNWFSIVCKIQTACHSNMLGWFIPIWIEIQFKMQTYVKYLLPQDLDEFQREICLLSGNQSWYCLALRWQVTLIELYIWSYSTENNYAVSRNKQTFSINHIVLNHLEKRFF